AVVDAGIRDWERAPETVVADVLPQVGAAADGEIAAFIDAPVVEKPVVALRTRVPVEAGETYTFSARVRALSETPRSLPIRFDASGVEAEIPDLNADWQTVEGEFTAADDQTEAEVRIVLDGPVEGLGVDDVTVAAAGGDNLVPNPSFEAVDASGAILNDSLVLRQDSAALGVNLAAGEARWSARRYEDGSVVDGTAQLRDGVSAIPLEGVSQGYYTITVTDASGREVSAPAVVLDYAGSRIPQSDRLGAATHLERDAYRDGGEAAASLGLSAARNDIKWSQNEPSPGSYQWTQTYIDELGKLKAQGVDLLGVIDSGNLLYTGTGGQAEWQKLKTPPTSQQGIDAFGRFARAIAERFDVIGIEVWNEFNHEPFNKGCRTADCYLPLLQAVEKNVKGVDPDIAVVAGATANYDEGFLNSLWQIGGLKHSDVTSFHPYDIYGDPDGAARVVGRSIDSMKANGEEQPVWITELGWTTGGRTAPVSLDTQANRLIRAEVMALAAGGDKYFWYDLISDPAQVNKQGDAHEANFGLFDPRREGLQALPPKPAAFSQALLASKIAGREPVRSDGIEGVRSVRFGEDGDEVRVAWVANGNRTVEYEAEGDVQVTDAWGRVSTVSPRDGKVSVELTSSPVFIEPAPAE
ncbi:hypothetical protein, partial [Microbacterium paludicola]|uniref:hypothetical protein n=1 Tax=Microbacterium paludicola TaxID=300019 RepID=UPI0014303893